MATYYMRADGTAANKAAATGPATDASKCMNITVHNAESFSSGDSIIVSDAGGIYRAKLVPPSDSVTYTASGSPTIYGSNNYSGVASYQWTLSGSGTNEYYLQTTPVGVTPDIFSADFEEGDLTDVTGTIIAGSNTVVASNLAEKNGTYGVRCTFDGTNEDAAIYKTITNTSTVYLKAWMKLEDFTITGADSHVEVMRVGDGATGNTAVRILMSGGTYYIRVNFLYSPNTSGSWYDLGSSLPSGWVRLEFYSNNGGGSGNDTIRAKLYNAAGSLIWDSNNITQTSTSKNQTRVSAGCMQTSTTANPANGDIIDIDDFQADGNEWIGDPVPGDPGVVDTDLIMVGGTRWLNGTVGSLTDHTWDYGDNDSLGYSTIYLRDNSGDPDTTQIDVEVAQRGCVQMYQRTSAVLDGLIAKYGHGISYDGGFRMDECSYCTVQNCEAHHNRSIGISVGGSSDHCVIDGCTTSYNGAHNIVCGGNVGAPATYCEIKNCIAHHSYTINFVPQPFDGYGLKFLWVDNSSMHGNLVYSNAINGIDLDGDGTNPGCRYNDIYENEIYDNDIIGVMIELRSTNNRIFRNRIYDNGKAGTWGNDQILFWHGCADCEVFNNVIYRTTNDSGSNPLIRIGDFEATPCDGIKIYGNVLDGGGYSNNVINLDSAYATAVDLKIKNNIIVNTASTPISIVSSSYTGFECDYNCYDDFGGSNIISRNYTGYTKATHCSGFSQDCNSVVSDPLLKDEATNKYWPTKDSPCLGVGVNLGSSYNLQLKPSSSWPTGVRTMPQPDDWNMGAYGLVTETGITSRYRYFFRRKRRHGGGIKGPGQLR